MEEEKKNFKYIVIAYKEDEEVEITVEGRPNIDPAIKKV